MEIDADLSEARAEAEASPADHGARPQRDIAATGEGPSP
jgi:hypothetical protein